MGVAIGAIRLPATTSGLDDPWVIVREAERLGFESVWAGEHHVIPGDTGSKNAFYTAGVPGMSSPLITLAGAAAVTRTMKVGTGVLLPVQRNPLLLAKEIASLDADSGGRLEVGIGLGWNREECEIMGGDFSQRAAQAKEAVQVMKLLWSEEFVEFHGKFYDFPLLKSAPGPITKPHPPILLGMHTDQALNRIVDYADGWLEAVTDPDKLVGVGIEHIAGGRAKLDRLAVDAGRDPASISIRVLLIDRDEKVDQTLIGRYTEAGANHVQLLGTPNLPEAMTSQTAALEWIRRVADRVL